MNMKRDSIKSELERIFRKNNLISISDSGRMIAINIAGLDKPCALTEQYSKIVRVYPARWLGKILKLAYPNTADELIKQYREVLNTLRRNKFDLSFYTLHSGKYHFA